MAEDKIHLCGLFNWRPSYLQRLASPKIYIALYFLIGVIQGTTFSYLSVVLSTIEKEFGLKTEEAAWLYSGNEISQIAFIFALPFVTRVKRRTLYVGLAMVASALGALMMALPHFIKPSTRSRFGVLDANYDMCLSTSINIRETTCSEDTLTKDYLGMSIMFIGIFIFGIGTSFYFSFGISYADDNSEKNNSPMALSLIFAARTLGPTLGFFLGTVTLKTWVNIGETPDFGEDDPRWIGAWWIGFVAIGVLLLIFGPFLTLFPQQLPVESSDARELAKAMEIEPKPQTLREWVDEMYQVFKRLFTNKVWLANFLSTLFLLFGIIGFATFLPKYLEYHFRQTASTGGAIGGSSKTAASVLGLLLSGWLVSRYRFGPKVMAFFCAVGTFVGALSFVIITFTACPALEVNGVNSNTLCLSDCQCSEVEYHPICHEGTNYFSPCHAGCRYSNKTTPEEGAKAKNQYWDCSCLGQDVFPLKPPSSIRQSNPPAIDGYCPGDCGQLFFILLGLLFFLSIVSSATTVPNMLIALRVIDKRDKSASLTLNVSLLSLFAFLPSPLIFGRIFDSSCKLWGQKCGEETNCLVYNTDKMRYGLGGLATAAMFCAFLADLAVWYLIDPDLDIYGLNDQGQEKEDDRSNQRDSGIEDMVEIELKETSKEYSV